MRASLRDWQDRTIYFILTDRFYNGDRSNDDQKQGEYDPSNDDCFHGGDLKGVRLKLPHIKKLGFDAIWLTPPVHNQWTNPYVSVRGYHGYWAKDFLKVDPHFGTLEDYRELVREAHRLGLKVIQDIVVNHTGNFFTVDEKGWNPEHPERTWRRVAEGPDDPVFGMNDPNDPKHRAADVYNFTPNIADFRDRTQTLTRALGDLDDINLHSPLAIRRMKEIYRYWIAEADVDAFRVDTVYYTPEDFYEKFLFDEGDSPGVKAFARLRGKKDFLAFGEVWSYDCKSINRYLQDGRTARLDSAIDLPLNEALTQTFFRAAPTETLRSALKPRRVRRGLWVNFLDNHDVERMASRGSPEKVRQALVALFTLPGIPCVYYGTEAGLKAPRQDMFDEKYFETGSEAYRFLALLIGFRKAIPALRRGACAVERASLSPGVLAWRRMYKDEDLLVVFNTSHHRMFFDLGGDAPSDVLLSSEKTDRVDPAFILPPDSYFVLKRPVKGDRRRAEPRLSLTAPKGTLRDKAALSFDLKESAGLSSLFLLCDDDWDARQAVELRPTGSFELDTGALGNGKHRLQLAGQTSAGGFVLSQACSIKVRNRYRLLASAAPAKGRRKSISPPGDPSYDGQLSIERVRVYTSGRDLRLMIRMKNVTDEWNPPNGYDHVYFNIFFDFPGQPGKSFFPKLNRSQDDFEFNAGFLLYGWGGVAYDSSDSTEQAYGSPLPGEAQQAVDVSRRTIVFTFSKRYFESLASFAGTKIYISTWDGYLGELRAISDKPENWSFHSASGDRAKVYDEVRIQL
jgi:glycosidase